MDVGSRTVKTPEVIARRLVQGSGHGWAKSVQGLTSPGSSCERKVNRVEISNSVCFSSVNFRSLHIKKAFQIKRISLRCKLKTTFTAGTAFTFYCKCDLSSSFAITTYDLHCFPFSTQEEFVINSKITTQQCS